MDDEEFVRLADNNKSLLTACSDPALGMKTVVEEHDIVYGLYPSTDAVAGWQKYRIKGGGRCHNNGGLVYFT